MFGLYKFTSHDGKETYLNIDCVITRVVKVNLESTMIEYTIGNWTESTYVIVGQSPSEVLEILKPGYTVTSDTL